MRQRIIFEDPIVKVPLTKNLWATIDNADYSLISEYRWYAQVGRHTNYGFTIIAGKTAMLHRLLLGATDKHQFVDHIDGDGLNNRRSNLRIVTPRQNTYNGGKYAKRSSKYRGVRQMSDGRWKALITAGAENGQVVRRSKICTSEIDAAMTYDSFASHLWGEYARLNFPERKGGLA